MESLETSTGRESVIAAMGSATLMVRIKGAEVISDRFQITGRCMGLIGETLAIATMFGLDPTVDGVFNIEKGAGMGATAHCTKGDA